MIDVAAIRFFRNYVEKLLHGSFCIVPVMFVTVALELFDCNPSLPEQSVCWVSHRNAKFTGRCYAVY